MGAEDLMGAVFPDQIACAENLPGEREIPDHPLVRQAIGDSLTEAMDIAGLERLLRDIESGAVRVTARDLTEPSPLALEVLSARPYAYLDDAPLEERRTQAVMARRWMSPDQAADLGRLDPEAVARVRAEAWPEPENADELHDALAWLGFLTEAEVNADPRWDGFVAELTAHKRVAQLQLGSALSISAERLPQFRALCPTLKTTPALTVPAPYEQRAWSRDEALVEIVRGRLEGLGPVCADVLAGPLGLSESEIALPLAALEAEGFAMRGRFTPDAGVEEWCERRLLSRIHHYTLKRLRAEIEPVAARDFLRFLFAWQHVSGDARMAGPKALDQIVAQLEGFEAPAAASENGWPARLGDYEPAWLDERCLAGQIGWMRLRPRNGRAQGGGRPAPVRTTPITLLPRRHTGLWSAVAPRDAAAPPGSRAQAVADCIKQHGASFFDELSEGTGLLRSELEEALAELVALGLVTSDSFSGLRALLVPSSERRNGLNGRRRRRRGAFAMDEAGRWAMVRRPAIAERKDDAVEHIARALLARYGVVFWRLLERETARLPPWRDLLRVYRRLESRGEIRGGRFVAGFSGEQFALPEAIGMLRATRRQPASDQWVSVSGADPLNLVGILTPGPKLPALTGNRLLYRDGIPTAFLAADDIQFLESLDDATEWKARKALLRGPVRAPSIAPEGLGEDRRDALNEAAE